MQWLAGGYASYDNKSFEPPSVSTGSRVITEGYHMHQNRKTYWVHALAVINGRILTEVREYLNICVIVVRIRKAIDNCLGSPLSAKYKKMWQSKSKLAYNDYVLLV